jgi:hypothetical protein
MDHVTAQRLMAIYERIGSAMADADVVIRTLPEAERLQHLHALAGLVNHVWFELQLPIVQEHQDLDPDRAYFQNRTNS